MNSEMEKCPSFEGCEAPLCPLDENLELCLWYPDEDICCKRGAPCWVKNQRKIVKIVGRDNAVGFFDIARLRQLKIVRKGIRGKNPDGKVLRRRGSAVLERLIAVVD